MPSDAPRPLEIDDLFAIRLVSDPVISPDSTRVAWVVTTLDRDADTYKAALWIADLDGGNARQLTSGMHRDTAPAWAPDGRSIAFVSNRPGRTPAGQNGETKDTGKPVGQIWTIAVDGGEARQVTTHPTGASSPSWSPDSRRIAFVASDETGADDPYTAPVTKGNTGGELVVHDIRYRFNGKGFLTTYSHIWAVDVASGDAVQLTNTDANDTSPAWSPDGRLIAFLGNRRDDRRQRPAQTLQIVPASGGEVRTIAPSDASFGAIAWSPDGTRLAFIGHEDALNGGARNNAVWTVKADGSELRNLTEPFDLSFVDAGMSDIATGEASAPVWAGDATVLALGARRGATHLWRIGPDGGEPQALTPDNQRVMQFDRAKDGSALALVVGETNRPFRLCRANADGSQQETIFDRNEQLVKEVYLATPIELDVTAPDGGKVQAWLLPPRGLDPGASVRYPLIVEIHGGPHAMYGHAMFHEMQVMASRGYGVLFCNPRGSSGYGEAFTGITRGCWGESDMPDVIAAVDEASKLDWVDTDRLGVTGGSYGGYLTNWIVSHDTRFKAAVTQRCVSNFHSFVGTSDIGFDFGIFEFDGTPWGDADKLLKYSPISYVDRIETPLLIIHGEQDLRCPIEQAEQMYTALKYLDREVGFVRIPDENHELSRSGTPSRRIARLEHLIGWFDNHL
jgi:dipeptidyl aminopeptidase/acylaminoacyl peptidase